MFWTRLASGIVLVIVAFLTIMAGGNIWFLVVSLYPSWACMNFIKRCVLSGCFPDGLDV